MFKFLKDWWGKKDMPRWVVGALALGLLLLLILCAGATKAEARAFVVQDSTVDSTANTRQRYRHVLDSVMVPGALDTVGWTTTIRYHNGPPEDTLPSATNPPADPVVASHSVSQVGDSVHYAVRLEAAIMQLDFINWNIDGSNPIRDTIFADAAGTIPDTVFRFRIPCSQVTGQVQNSGRNIEGGNRSNRVKHNVAFQCQATPPPVDTAPPIDTVQPPVVTPPPTGGDVLITFDTPADLTQYVTCAGAPAITSSSCPLGVPGGNADPCRSPIGDFPASASGCYRDHAWVASDGVNGTGALAMHWRTGMPIGFSPVWIDVPRAQHFKVRYAVKQTAPMHHTGSAIKLLRMCAATNCPGGISSRIGTLESKQGRFAFYWDAYETGGATDLGIAVPSDSQWHIYELEMDYRTTTPTMTFWLDGVFVKTDRAPKSMSFPSGSSMTMSPVAEMYSCGPSGCSSSINTGDYVVDDFSFTILP